MSFITQPVTLQSLFGVDRKVGEITMSVVISEATSDTLTVTKNPVQRGTPITDHAYKNPTILTMVAYEQDPTLASLSKLYDKFLALQKLLTPFDVITPKRIYKNVLMSVLTQNTDKTTENCLSLTMGFEEIVIVSVTTAEVPRARQRNPGTTGATQKAGKKSALVSGKEGFNILRGGGG